MDAIRVLVVDDETQLVDAFRKRLERDGCIVSTAYRAEDVFPLIDTLTFDVAVLDIRLPDMDGVELLGKLKELEPTLEVIMLTGHASVDTAIKSMKLGAYDYLVKPCKLSELSSVIFKAFEKKSLRQKNIVLEEHVQRLDLPNTFVGESAPMVEVKRVISLVGDSEVPILITGETGTGKELAARAIHAVSQRSSHPFVAINSSTLQESILESELFGYKKGAFTGAQTDKIGLFEIANKGTFFVDEVGDMNPSIQAKLLRVLETGIFRKLGDTKEINVNVRFIFATNKTLEEEVDMQRFRKDLFYRINTFVLLVPPLRERKEDIPLLVSYFLNKLARGARVKGIAADAMKTLKHYGWPGNVRELANVLERALLLAGIRPEITIDHLPATMMGAEKASGQGPGGTKPGKKSLKLNDAVKDHVDKVLDLTGGNKSEAARLLGISRKKLYRKIIDEE